MARPLRIEYEGAFYYITARGYEGKKMFEDTEDKEKFLYYLGQAKERFKIIIHAFCLLDNNYQLLLETPLANLSCSMQSINSSYTTYFNKHWHRKGHLFQGRYKAILVDKDYYVQEVSRYIHLNPVKAGLTSKPELYSWSSYKYYLNNKYQPYFLTTDFILSFFGKESKNALEKYCMFVEDEINNGFYTTSLKNITGGSILGKQGFVQWVKYKFIDKERAYRDLPSLRKLKIDAFNKQIIRKSLMNNEDFSAKERKKIEIYLTRKYTGLTLGELSKNYPDLTVSGISQIYRRLAQKRKNEIDLDRKLKVIEEKIV